LGSGSDFGLPVSDFDLPQREIAVNTETKFGLLVGLAFVIVIGIYLSDHASNTNQPPQAPLQLAGTSVRTSLGDSNADDGVGIVRVPPVVTPRHLVPTRKDLTHRSPDQATVLEPFKSQTPTEPADPADELAKKAAAGGEPVERVTDRRDVPPPVVSGNRSYVAQPGDSLGAMARKAYGSGSLANRRAIEAANPSLVDNQDMVIAGRTYVIPPLASASGSSPVMPQPSSDPLPADHATYYTVQSGDTLWSIAKNQAGTSAAQNVILDLNKDVLHGSAKLRVGMKLRMPKKPA
jgi:LysM repeat protein